MSVKLPKSVVDGLRIGLRLHKAGKGGKGLVDETLRMARQGVRTGRWPEWKVVKASAWFARHVADRRRMKNPRAWNKAPNYSPAYVAWALWGDTGSGVGRRWIDKKAKELKAQGVTASSRKNPQKKKGISKTTDYHRAGAAAWSELGLFPLAHPDGLSTLWLAMYGPPLPADSKTGLSRAWRKAGSKEMIAALRDLSNGTVLPRTKGVRVHHSILKGDSQKIIDSIIRSGLRADPKGVGRSSEAPNLIFFSAGTYHSKNAPVVTFDIPPSWEGWSNGVNVDYNRSKGTLVRRPEEGSVVAVSGPVPAKFLVAVNGIPLSEYRKASPRKNPPDDIDIEVERIIREQDRRAKEKKRKIKEISKLINSGSVEFTDGEDFYGVVTPDPAESGRWRITRYDSRGLIGHTTFDTVEQAVVRLIEDRQVIPAPGTFDRMAPRKSRINRGKAKTQPYKYGVPKKYLRGLPDKVAKKRAAEIIRRREQGIKTSSPLPGDKLARKKPMRGSKWTRMYKKQYGEGSGTTRSAVARDTGIPVAIINEVYKRGVGASRTAGRRPGATDSSWALARVHAFVMKVLHKKGPINQDPDLARKVMARRNPVIKAKGISDADVRRLGEAYLDGEDILSTRRGRQMARAAAEKVHRDFEKVKKKVRVIFTERDPYPDFEALRADVRNNKRMYIYTGHSVTPLWDEQTNWKARAVHDYDHVTEGAGFGLHGEFMAFRASAKRSPQLSELYMSEIPLQAAAYYLKGGFPDGPQKVVPVGPELTRLVNRLGMRQNPAKRRNRNRMATLALDAQILGKFMPPEQVAMHLGAMQDDAPVEEAVLATVSSIGRKRSRRNPPFRTPPYMRRCVVHLYHDGYDKDAAFAICNSSMQKAGYLSSGEGKLTQRELSSGKRKRKIDYGKKDQKWFDREYERILKK